MSGKRAHRSGSNGLVRQMGRSVRNSGLVVRGVAGLHRVGGTVLRYHSVSDDESWGGEYMQQSLVVAPEVFARQLDFLAKRYRVVSVGEMVDQMRSRRDVDPRCVAITFDDGYEDNYRNAFAVLKERGLTAS
ncbi:MAG: polysaccharide deacetylase family protein, partial [Candidatus Eisenbacteria bacterium]|nr:polysaccharide deacetylase family protein [Candidatus Eisenbacteria bacterium]